MPVLTVTPTKNKRSAKKTSQHISVETVSIPIKPLSFSNAALKVNPDKQALLAQKNYYANSSNSSENVSNALLNTISEYTESFNRVSHIGYTESLTNIKMHNRTYASEKQLSVLPSQLIISARAKSSEAVKSAKTWQQNCNRKYNYLLKKLKKENKPTDKLVRKIVQPPKSKKQSIRYDARSFSVDLENLTASLLTIYGRVTVKLHLSSFHKAKLQTAKVASATLVHGPSRKTKNKFFLNITVEKQLIHSAKLIEIPKKDKFSKVPQLLPKDTVNIFSDNFKSSLDNNKPLPRIIGVDLGTKNPAVTSDNKFHGKGLWQRTEVNTAYLTGKLQAKGTCSAKRHLRKLSGRVNGFRKNCDHHMSNEILESLPSGSLIILEDLSNCRDSITINIAGKNIRHKLHSWSFRRFADYLQYKGKRNGIQVLLVDAYHTSQRCSFCGHSAKKNRSTRDDFKCLSCGHAENADYNAAKNIRELGVMKLFGELDSFDPKKLDRLKSAALPAAVEQPIVSVEKPETKTAVARKGKSGYTDSNGVPTARAVELDGTPSGKPTTLVVGI